MATLTNVNPSLLDLAKLSDPNGTQAEVVRIMDQSNAVLNYFSFIEGNLPTGHRTTISAGLPGATWRGLYQFVQPDTGKRVQVTENTGELVAYGLVDKSLVDIAANPAAFRLEEDTDHIEGLSQELAKAIFYSSEVSNVNQITGLSPRYNSLSAGNARNIFDAGGTGTDNRSIWLCVTGPTTITGIVPSGTTAGIQVNDKGLTTVHDSNGAPAGGMMEAYVTHYVVRAGVSVRNWKYAVRICNIDHALLSTEYSGGKFQAGADLIDLMYQAYKRIPNLGRGNAAWYMDMDTSTWIERQLAAKIQNSTLGSAEVGGITVDTFRGIPMAITDALEVDEARVV